MRKKKAVDESPAAQLGRAGGKATVKKYGKTHMRKLSALAVEKRKANHAEAKKAG